MSTAALQYAAALQETGCTLAQLEAAAAYLTGSAPLWEALCSPAVEALSLIHILNTDFEGGRHARRVGEITAMEEGR